jgi:hypothetical protein
MTKTELVEKISAHYQVQEPDSKFFFETLLKKVHKSLDADETLILKDLVSLQVHKDEPGNNFITFILDSGEKFLFDVPAEEEAGSSSLDSYFSLSFGKPVIPMRGSVSSDFFVSNSSDDAKKIIELKVEGIIEEAREIEYQKSLKGEDFLESSIDFSFMNWKTTSSDNKLAAGNEKDDVKNTLSETSPWDFKDEEIVSDEHFEEKSEPAIEETPEIEIKEPEPGNEQIIANDEFDSSEIIIDEVKSDLSAAEEEIKPEIELTEEVQAQDDSIVVEQPVSIVEDQPVIEELIEDSDVESFNDVVGEEVVEKNTVVLNEIQEFIAEYRDNEKIGDNIFTNENEYQTRESSDLQNEETETADDDSSAIKEAFKFAEEKRERIERYSRKRSYAGFIFSAVILIVISAVIYFSYLIPEDNITANSLVQQTRAKNFAVVIERNYDYPVTYPYYKGMFGGFYSAFSPDLISTIQKQLNEQNTNTKVTQSVTLHKDELEIREPLPAERVKGYVYKYENMYAVQLSSWKSKSIALSETKKLLNAGNPAFIERTNLYGETYYRVRVGGFNSLKEAEQFLIKNKQ